MAQVKGLQIGRTKSPCYGCENRTAECHGSCADYKKYEEIHAQERAAINAERHKENLAYGAPYRTDRELRSAHLSFDSTCSILRRQKKER